VAETLADVTGVQFQWGRFSLTVKTLKTVSLMDRAGDARTTEVGEGFATLPTQFLTHPTTSIYIRLFRGYKLISVDKK
jgi:hypothetical protein